MPHKRHCLGAFPLRIAFPNSTYRKSRREENICAVIVVGHLSKQRSTKALYRTIGSIDIVDAARSALLISRTDKARPDERIMAVQKCNLALAGPAVVFSVGDKIEWIGQTDQTADDILGGA